MGQILQSGASIITNKLALHHYKVGQELLQNGSDNLLQSGGIIIIKWGQILQSGATLLQSGAGIKNWGIKLEIRAF